jgi:hypothetical protein
VRACANYNDAIHPCDAVWYAVAARERAEALQNSNACNCWSSRLTQRKYSLKLRASQIVHALSYKCKLNLHVRVRSAVAHLIILSSRH